MIKNYCLLTWYNFKVVIMVYDAQGLTGAVHLDIKEDRIDHHHTYLSTAVYWVDDSVKYSQYLGQALVFETANRFYDEAVGRPQRQISRKMPKASKSLVRLWHAGTIAHMG